MANQIPLVSGSNHTFSVNQQHAVTDLFTASDPDGSVVTYNFYDSTPGAGYFTFDGAHISGTSISVSAANLSRVGYFTGSSAGTNDVACDVVDNSGALSATRTITLTVAAPTNQQPIVSGSNQTFSVNQQHAVTDLFTASDPDGSVVTYNFYDSTPGAGYFTFDGAHISGTSISVSAANLSRVGYFTGSSAGTNDVACDVVDNSGALSATRTITLTVAAPIITDTIPGNSSTTATLTIGQTTNGQIDALGLDGRPGDADYYRVNLLAGHSYTFSANANVSLADTLDQAFIRLRDPGGNLLSPDLSAGGSATPQLTFTAQTAGTYYFGIGADGSGTSWLSKTGSYSIAAADTTPAPPIITDTIPGNSSTTAALTMGQTLWGQIDALGLDGRPGDADYHRVNLLAGHTYTFTANANVSLIDSLDQVFTRLRDPNGHLLTPELSAGGSPTPQLTFTPQTDGTYYFGIGADGSGTSWISKTGSYSITVDDGPSLAIFAQLADAAYHLLPAPIEVHQSGINNEAAALSDLAYASVRSEFNLLTASDLPTLAPRSVSDVNFPTLGIVQGVYLNENAAALVAQSGSALYVAFRGTNDVAGATLTADEKDWLNLPHHYSLFAPLNQALTNSDHTGYLDIHPEITNVYVTGHSLGAAMAQAFMAEHLQDKYEAVLFANPGYEEFTRDVVDHRVTNLWIDGDPILYPTDVLSNRGNQNTIYHDGSISGPTLHDMALYQAYAQFLTAEGITVGSLDGIGGRDYDSLVSNAHAVATPDQFVIGGVPQQLVSTTNPDRIFGSSGNDTFVFGANFGADTVRDFRPAEDHIQFDRTLFSNSIAVLAAATDDGHGGVLITHDAQNTILLEGVRLADLHASNFILA
ncbi:pre-peptidase C-terminal domain-containing protein [Bradyrhizobium sp. CW7]|uniref:pre-peptidase C-terminal domain-containing protein n=1 Tax=Bradyrhizobium sp. CW7 TaxID=2782688 RepID=UPI001FFBCD54|nr:pre-peptidase C-terminal domain-containing protein [Bradyrhizobium sp. CW7]MCK1356337.1 pre-peptidase C-terminal domain-containing protein [Bradyrhizobium sp. CW7]